MSEVAGETYDRPDEEKAEVKERKPAAEAKPRPPLVTGGRVAPIIPRNIDEVARVAQAVLVAGLAPDSYRATTTQETISKVMIGIMKGAEVGLPPLSALSNIAIINGRPSIWGDGAMALVQGSGLLEWIKERFEGTGPNDDSALSAVDSWTAICIVKRFGREPVERRFSVGEAKRAKLWGNVKRDPWIKYPQRMLQMRARSWALRDEFPDVLAGLAIAEEAQDMPVVQVDDVGSILDDDAPAIAHQPEQESTPTANDAAAPQEAAE